MLVLELGEWRPRKAPLFPLKYRLAVRCVLLLAKSRHHAPGAELKAAVRYPQSALYLLPEELLQMLLLHLSSAPVMEEWLSEGNSSQGDRLSSSRAATEPTSVLFQ